MKGCFIAILAVLFLCLINYGTDLAFYLKNRLSRYHVGRWTETAWRAAVERRAVHWLQKTPVVKITDNSRYILLDLLQGRYKSQTIQSWQKAALILGLLESDREDSRQKAGQYAIQLTDEAGNWRHRPTQVDCGMLSFALLRATENPDTIRKAMDYSAALIKACLREEGMISYTGSKNDPNRYVDTLGLCCPFLYLYGKTYHMPDFERIAVNQIEKFHLYGMLRSTALPNHAFDIQTKLPLGVFGWGRGIGWYVISLLDTYLVAESNETKKKLESWILEAADEYLRYQREDGGFGSIIQSKMTYDSSATASLAWFYSVCGKLFQRQEYSAAAEKCLQKLKKCTRISGAIDWCQGDTKGIGVFSQTYDVMPFAQGMCVRAIYQSVRK